MSVYLTPYGLYQRPDRTRSKVSSEVHVPLDVRKDGQDYVIELLVPGLEAENLEIEIVEKTIEVKGEFNGLEEGENIEYLRRERPTGKFRRVIRLPKLLDMNKSEAKLDNGILSLRVPVAEEALPKTIKVKVK